MKITSAQGLNTPIIYDYYQKAHLSIREALNNYPHDKLLGTKTDELTEYLFQHHALSPLEIDESRLIEWEPVISKRRISNFAGEIFDTEVTQARVIFPINPGFNIEDALRCHTSNKFLHTTFLFDFDNINYTVSIEENPENIQNVINKYQTVFEERTLEINSKNIELRELIRSLIERRKLKIIEDGKALDVLMQKVTIPLKKRGELPSYQVPLQVRTDLKKLAYPKSSPPKDLDLTHEQLSSIIQVIEVDGKNFENAPETFSKLDEPDLRNVMVGHLNHYFPDDVTGETFVKLGKADIRLKVFEGEILLAECKYWTGEEEYAKAIEQLFRYLTWRYNYGLIIIFSKNFGFTEVLEKIKRATQRHSSYQGNFTELTKTHFRSVHTYPDDPQKKVEIHILVYNLYFTRERI
jgi:hypothetical protein